MNASQWERAKEIFDSALELPSDSRPEFLLQACEGDAAVRAEVDELLKASADADSSSFLDSGWLNDVLPLDPDFALQPGDVICERFQIIRPIGDGGMGRVYEAYDSEVDAEVALKTLRPEIANNPEVLKRFRQEVRIAHRITHPNVCRTFHLDHDIRPSGPDDQHPVRLVFLTMEYLDGETLQQIVKREGRLPLPRALAIARQMADAIEAAHNIGVIHRDIKPGNVIICPAASGNDIDARVVVTDFGLAKLGPGAANSDLSSISHVGRPMGTLPYMSPEQLEAGEAGPATDIYAFGLVLFEMVTGSKAFPDSDTLQAAFRRITEPPPDPKTLAPDLPAEWEAAILGCLQIDPAARFQRACDVIDVLEGATPSSSRTHTRRPLPLAKPAPRRRKIFALAAVLAVLVALFWFGFRFFTIRNDAAVAPGTLVYLAPVKNETGEKQLDNVTELVRAGLEQSGHIRLLDAARVGDLLHDMKKPDAEITEPIAREIALRANAARVIFASVTGAKGSYQLKVEIQRPDNSSPIRIRNHSTNSWSWKNDGPSSDAIPTEALRTVREATGWIRQQVGEAENDVARLDVPPEDVTTSNWQALADYVYAEKLYGQTHREEAVTVLQQAIQKDPGFALAHAFMGDILTNLGHHEEGYKAYQGALDGDLSGRLSLRERDRIKGMIGQDTDDFQAAEAAYREYTLNYEYDYNGWFRRARPLFLMGRTRDAIHALEKAHQLDPSKPIAIVQLTGAHLVLGDMADVDKWVAELQHNYRREYFLYANGPVQVVRADYNGAALTFDELSKSELPAFQWAGSAMLANLRAEQGRYREAADILTARLERDRGNAALLLDRGTLFCKLRQFDACHQDFADALRQDPGSVLTLALCATLGRAIASSSGASRADFVKMLESLEDKRYDIHDGLVADIRRLRVRGELQLANNNPNAAIVQFRKASALDPSDTSREYLARALSVAALQQAHTPAAQTMLTEAAGYYTAIALHPATVWEFSQAYPPGFYADQMEAALSLSRYLPQPIPQNAEILKALSLLRPQSTALSGDGQRAAPPGEALVAH